VLAGTTWIKTVIVEVSGPNPSEYLDARNVFVNASQEMAKDLSPPEKITPTVLTSIFPTFSLRGLLGTVRRGDILADYEPGRNVLRSGLKMTKIISALI
jgi:hypothetical protein